MVQSDIDQNVLGSEEGRSQLLKVIGDPEMENQIQVLPCEAFLSLTNIYFSASGKTMKEWTQLISGMPCARTSLRQRTR